MGFRSDYPDKDGIIDTVDGMIGKNGEFLLETAEDFDVDTEGLTYAQIRKAIIEAAWQEYKDGLLTF